MKQDWEVMIVHHNHEEMVPGTLEPLYLDHDLLSFDTKEKAIQVFEQTIQDYCKKSDYFIADDSGYTAFYWNNPENNVQTLTYVSIQLDGETVLPKALQLSI